jgi:predicted ATPase
MWRASTLPIFAKYRSGPADFLALARQFHTVVLDTIPVIGAGQRDEAKRFITRIDTFYEGHVKLIASAEAEPAELYAGSEGFVPFDSSAPHRVSLKCARRIISPCRMDRLAPFTVWPSALQIESHMV